MMFSKFKLETSFGELDFAIIQLSPWIKAYNSILWIAVVLSNALSLAYIIKKLNTSNLINLIAILECLVNILGFVIIGIIGLVAIADPSDGYISCHTNFTILVILMFTGKNKFSYHFTSIDKFFDFWLLTRSHNCLFHVNCQIRLCQIWARFNLGNFPQKGNHLLPFCDDSLCDCDYSSVQ